MTHEQSVQRNARPGIQGFALIVVLSGLAIITALFAISSNRGLGILARSSTESQILSRAHVRHEVLSLASKIVLEPTMPRVITLPPPYANMPVHLTDVGQLIDLNSSAPQLVDLLFEELNLSPDQRQRFRQWRRTGSRVLRVTDLFRILEISPSDAPEIFHLATVHSGRVGISEPEIDDAIYNFTRRLPTALQTPPTGNTFVVSLARSSGYLGVVRLTSQGRGIVLEAE